MKSALVFSDLFLRPGMRVDFILPLFVSGVAMAQSAGTFTRTGSMITPRFGHTATLLPNGKVLIAGGLTGCFPGIGCPDTNNAELYDPATAAFAPTRTKTMSVPP